MQMLHGVRARRCEVGGPSLAPERFMEEGEAGDVAKWVQVRPVGSPEPGPLCTLARPAQLGFQACSGTSGFAPSLRAKSQGFLCFCSPPGAGTAGLAANCGLMHYLLASQGLLLGESCTASFWIPCSWNDTWHRAVIVVMVAVIVLRMKQGQFPPVEGFRAAV